MIKCKFCDLEFTNEIRLGQHMSAIHPDSRFPCPHPSCDKLCNSRSAVHAHKKVCPNRPSVSSIEICDSGNDESSQDNSLKTCVPSNEIRCGICDDNFASIEALCNHLQTEHLMPAEVKEISFGSEAEFNIWRRKVEADRKFEYHSRRGSRVTKTSLVKYLYCHRTGSYESVAEGKRAPKRNGSIKTGRMCSAFAIVTICSTTGTVKVKCCTDHYGHDNLLARMKLPPDVVATVCQYFKDGQTVDWIINKLRSGYEKKKDEETGQTIRILGRENIVNRHDIDNIIARFRLRKEQLDKVDLISVDLHVKRFIGREFTPFFCYTNEGDGEKLEKFTLGIQTRFQLDMLKTFGGKAILVDATHNTSKYRFQLVTVLVVDDFGKGFPVAWMITSRETQEYLTEFFTALKQRSGQIDAKVFMSDDADQYWNAWRAVFGFSDAEPPRKLLCSWHVKKNWKQATQSKLDPYNGALVRNRLAILFKQPTRSAFQNLLTKFLTEMDAVSSEFSGYFRREYCNSQARIEQWAMYARRGSVVNVNMFVEAFHRTFKSKFLLRKENQRLDGLMRKLFEAANWYLSQYVIAIERGGAENNYRQREMHKHHREADKMSLNNVKIIDDRHWSVQSASTPDTSYDVVRLQATCECHLRCQFCDVCPEMFDCTCPNALFLPTACKHVHLVQMSLTPMPASNSNVAPKPPPTVVATLTDVTDFMLDDSESNSDSQDDEIAALLDKIKTIVPTIENADARHELLQKLRVAASYASAYATTPVPRTTAKEPYVNPNKRMATQSRYFEKRRKSRRQDNNDHCTNEMVEAIRDHYEELTSEICGVCLKSDPTTVDNADDDTDWVQCHSQHGGCKTWFHTSCAWNYDSSSEHYVCEACAKC